MSINPGKKKTTQGKHLDLRNDFPIVFSFANTHYYFKKIKIRGERQKLKIVNFTFPSETVICG